MPLANRATVTYTGCLKTRPESSSTLKEALDAPSLAWRSLSLRQFRDISSYLLYIIMAIPTYRVESTYLKD